MKKLAALTFLFVLLTCSYVSARTIYDSTGRNIIYDDTLRGRKKAAELQVEKQKQMQAAAAARMNYNEETDSLDENSTKQPKTNYYQAKDRITDPRILNSNVYINNK